jgi:hypothetical protein
MISLALVVLIYRRRLRGTDAAGALPRCVRRGEVRLCGFGRVSSPQAPAIDEDDEREGDHPDRSLRWTRYQRSHVNLGSKGRLGDDRYVALMTAAFSAGAARVLRVIDEAGGSFPASRRQTVLLTAVVAGLADAGLAADERTRYLAYHRDWLVRWELPERERQAKAVARFDGRVEEMAPALAQVENLARRRWSAGTPGTDAWGIAIHGLAAYLATFRGIPSRAEDPFTDDPVFPALFKVFHNLANVLGVGMLDEAFTHHLVLRAVTAEAAATGGAAGGAP